jgi:hypothetical protein
VTFQNNRVVPSSTTEGGVFTITTPFLAIKQTTSGAVISSAAVGYEVPGSPFQPEGVLSFCTRFGDVERARIDAQGLSCKQFASESYIGLVDTYDKFDGFKPASANALANAYVDLSNMIVTASSWNGAGTGAGGGGGGGITLVNSYASTSVTEAPTANALRIAHDSLSNSLGAQLLVLSNNIRTQVYDAVVDVARATAIQMSSSNGVGTGPGTGTGETLLVNNIDLRSIPDGQARFSFSAGGESVFKSTGNRNDLGIDRIAFGWTVNDLDESVMSLTGNGNLWIRGSVDVGSGDLMLRSNLQVGAVTLRTSGSNLGIDLPPGIDPQYGLHVRGLIYSEEGVYALSDAREKTGLKPIEDALDRIRKIQGYTYHARGRARMGLQAQEVREVAPQATSEDADGRLSVAYGDVLALVVQAIRELDRRVVHDPTSRPRSVTDVLSDEV